MINYYKVTRQAYQCVYNQRICSSKKRARREKKEMIYLILRSCEKGQYWSFVNQTTEDHTDNKEINV